MLPILYVTNNTKAVEDLIDETVNKYDIPSSSVFKVHPEATILTIDQIRDVNKLVREVSNGRVIVLYNFDSAKVEGQNALLKTLEEHNVETHFILVVSDETQVLPTIQSRTRTVYHLEQDDMTKHKLLMKFGLLEDSLTHEQWLSVTAKLRKDQAIPLIDEIIRNLRQRLHTGPSVALAQGISETLHIRRYIEKNNINYEYALDKIASILDQKNLLPLA